MPSLTFSLYGFCAAFLVAYLVGWPVSIIGGVPYRRLRLFIGGSLAAFGALFAATREPIFSAVFALVGAAVAVGFAEIGFTGPAIAAATPGPSPEHTPPTPLDFEDQPTLRPPRRETGKPGGLLGPLTGRTIQGAPAPKSLLGPIDLTSGQVCPKCGTTNSDAALSCVKCHVSLSS